MNHADIGCDDDIKRAEIYLKSCRQGKVAEATTLNFLILLRQIPLQEIGMTGREMDNFIHQHNVKIAKENIEMLRRGNEGEYLKGYIKDFMESYRVSYEEAETTPEELNS